jgi:hypothetical protein
VTIKQLRAKLEELESSFDTAVDTKVKERERQLSRQQAENERAQQGEQLALVTKLGSLEQEVATLQAALVRAERPAHRTNRLTNRQADVTCAHVLHRLCSIVQDSAQNEDLDLRSRMEQEMQAQAEVGAFC